MTSFVGIRLPLKPYLFPVVKKLLDALSTLVACLVSRLLVSVLLPLLPVTLSALWVVGLSLTLMLRSFFALVLLYLP